MSAPYDRPALLRQMLDSFKRGVVTVTEAAMPSNDCEATVAWEWVGSRLHLDVRRDGSQGGYVRQILHELLHAHLHDSLRELLKGELHEGALRGIEDACMKHIDKHPRTHDRWRKAVTEKMEAE